MKALLLALAALLGAAVCAAVLFLWLLPSPAAPTGAGPEVRPQLEVAAPDPPALRSARDSRADAARSVVEDAAAPPEVIEPPPVERPLVALTGRLVDVRGAGLVGAEVRLEDRFGAAPPKELAGARSESDGTGRFRLELALPDARRWRTVELTARAAGFAKLRREIELVAGETDLGELVVAAAGRLGGLVLDASDRPVQGARVIAFGAGQRPFGNELNPPWELDAETATDPSGRFDLEDVPVGARFVAAGLEGHFWSYGEELDLRAREARSDLLLRLERIPDERRITLVVVDPEGRPVAGARISWRFELPNRSASGGGSADEQGRYEHVLSERTPHSYVVADPQELFRPASLEQVPPGTRDLEVRLGELRTLEIAVRDEAGDPIEEYAVTAVHVSEAGSWRVLGNARTPPPHADGRTELVVPGERFSLRVDADGFDLAQPGPFDPETVPAVLEISLERLPGVRGTVLADDQPLAGADVRMHEAPGGRLTVNGFDARYNRSPYESTVTDAEGRFELTLRKAGTFWVRAGADGRAPVDLGPLELLPSLGAADLVLELGRGGALAGRVLLPLGEQAVGTIVGASRGDGHAVTQRADSQGRYRFEGLTPGPWLVARADEEITAARTSTSMSGGTPEEPEFNCEVIEGGTTRFDLDLTGGPPVVLEGRLLLSGLPATGWQAELSRDMNRVSGVRLGADGRFELRSSRAGQHQLTFEPAHDSGWNGSLSRAIDLPEGATPWSLDLPVGSLSGRVDVPPATSGNAIVASWRKDSLRYFAIVEPRPDSTYALPVVPAGEIVLTRREESGSVQLASGVVVSGQACVIDVR